MPPADADLGANDPPFATAFGLFTGERYEEEDDDEGGDDEEERSR